MAWEPRIYSASTVHRVPCFAPAPLCVGFYGFELFATVPRGLPPQPVKVPGTTTRPGCPVQVATTMYKCPRVFLSVSRLPGFCRRALYTMDYQQPAPWQLRPRDYVGTLYRCPRPNGFFFVVSRGVVPGTVPETTPQNPANINRLCIDCTTRPAPGFGPGCARHTLHPPRRLRITNRGRGVVGYTPQNVSFNVVLLLVWYT